MINWTPLFVIKSQYYIVLYKTAGLGFILFQIKWEQKIWHNIWKKMTNWVKLSCTGQGWIRNKNIINISPVKVDLFRVFFLSICLWPYIFWTIIFLSWNENIRIWFLYGIKQQKVTSCNRLFPMLIMKIILCYFTLYRTINSLFYYKISYF